MGLGWKFWLLVWHCFAALAWAEVPTSEFTRLYEGFRDGTPTRAQAPPENIRFILITGINGSLDPLYFSRMSQELRKLTGTEGENELANQRVFVVRPPTTRAVEEGDAYLDQKVRAIVAASPPGTRFRFVGHSLGGYRLWDYLNRHPDIAAKTDFSLFLQTPFGGSSLAQFIYEKRAISEALPPGHPFARATLWAAKQFFGLSRPSLGALAPENAQARLEQIRRTGDPALQQSIIDRSVVFTTNMEPFHGWATWIPGPRQFLNLCVKAMARLNPGPSDGMVRQVDQRLPGADHRTVSYENLHHRSLNAMGADAVPLARAVWALPVSGN